MMNVYKEKGNGSTCGSHRGIKLLEHAMAGAIFIVRQLREKNLAKNKVL